MMRDIKRICEEGKFGELSVYLLVYVLYTYVYITYKFESPYLNIPPLFDPKYIYIYLLI